MRLSGALRLVLFALALLASGCGAKMGQVDGKLVWPDGSPAKELAGSQVVFESAELRTSARGTVDADGNFRLTTTTPDDGAPVGEYRVALVENRKIVNVESLQLAPPVLATKFNSVETSELTATVKPGVTPVKLTVERVAK